MHDYNFECILPKISQNEFREILKKNMPIQAEDFLYMLNIINNRDYYIQEISFAGTGFFGNDAKYNCKIECIYKKVLRSYLYNADYYYCECQRKLY